MLDCSILWNIEYRLIEHSGSSIEHTAITISLTVLLKTFKFSRINSLLCLYSNLIESWFDNYLTENCQNKKIRLGFLKLQMILLDLYNNSCSTSTREHLIRASSRYEYGRLLDSERNRVSSSTKSFSIESSNRAFEYSSTRRSDLTH